MARNFGVHNRMEMPTETRPYLGIVVTFAVVVVIIVALLILSIKVSWP